MTHASPEKPGIHELLIASALDDGLRRRLLESPEAAFQDFELTDGERELLRHPDRRLLPYLGAALARQSQTTSAASRHTAEPAVAPHAVLPAHTLPDFSLVLTLVPCVQDGGVSYAVWVNPLPPGTDPATLPPPAGIALPGTALAPLHAVVQVSAVDMRDATGNTQIGLSAALRQSTNMIPLPPVLADPGSPALQSAVAAVRAAIPEERYDRLIDLIGVLRGGEAR